MSLIVSVYVNEGIVMASDSRTTYVKKEGDLLRIGVHSNNSTKKTFLCPNQAGISTCGEASVLQKPITGYIEAFIREKITPDTPVNEMPQKIIEYFKTFDPIPQTNFIICGYERDQGKRIQRVYRVRLEGEAVKQIDTENQGATWDGETMTLVKLLKPVALRTGEKEFRELPHPEILWNFFTLQDAIDFARYAVKTTIDTMHFQNVVETVGGDVDVLVLKPDESFWINRKELQ